MMWKDLPTPCYVVDEGKIRKNLEILADLEQECGCHILLAQKAFSMYSLYPMIGQYISGTTASGLYEARLGYEEMGKEKTIYIYNVCDHQECYKEVGSQAISYTTGVPAMIGAALVVDKVWDKDGVFNIEEFDPDPFMDMLNQYGLPWVVDEDPQIVE